VSAFKEILRDSLELCHQRAAAILIDVVWRAVWFGTTLALIAVLFGWFALQLSSLEWQGPDLAVSQPIILLYAAQQLWMTYSRVAAFGIIGVVSFSIILWLILEAYFRGGRQRFWVFLASSIARIAILASTAALLAALAYRDGSRAVALGALFIFLGMGLFIAVAEVLIRENSVELWATDFFSVLGVVGISYALEIISFALVGAMSAAFILASSRFAEVVISLGVSIIGLTIWTIFQSYLLIFRSSSVDIIRVRVGENVRDI
jgi:hypothetical protein